ncbi:MAG TPA: DUF2807 domain-containing protein [Bacteroidia bacterium]|jgi:hypothetical protein|nr:DUF2807 domain-containing protein [Bacteroidia bacterium]
MKTKNIFTALLIVASAISFAQTTQTREVTAFTRIDASGAPIVIYKTSDSLGITVTGDAGEINNVETRVVDGTLFIKPNGNFKHQCTVRITGNNLNSVSVSGATNFMINNKLTTDSFMLESSGASYFNAVDLNAKKIKANISGASNATILSGTSDNFTADASGASTLKAYKLISNAVYVTSSGASIAKVFASQKLVANATGASTIKFKGEPKEVSAEGSTSSQIIKIAADDSPSKTIGKDSTATTFNWGHKKIIISDDNHKYDSIHNARETNQKFRHWDGFFMGVTGFVDSKQSFSLSKPYNYMELDYSRSFNWQINLLQENIHLIKNYLNLCTGLGFDFNRYQFANKVKLNADSNFTWGKVDSTGTFSYKKNRLTSYYITVPLLLDINTSSNPKKSFHLSLGIVGKYLLGARTKQIIVKNGYTTKQIRNDGYNLNPFQFNAYASVGYGNVTLYAQYGLNEMFQHNKGPELYPFSVGVRLVNFN